jgi:hypothetical protein
MSKPNRLGRWRFNPSTNQLEFHEIPGRPATYKIDLDKMRTPAECLDAIYQAAFKRWMTVQDRSDLLEAIRNLVRPRRTFYSWGSGRIPGSVLDIIPPVVRYEVPKCQGLADHGLYAKVTPRSPKRLRDAAGRIAYYFKREGGYDFADYFTSPRWAQDTFTCYLWAKPDSLIVPGESIQIIGCACFRPHTFEDIGPRQMLEWVWLHPYYRGHGLLRQAWPYLWQDQGPFLVQPPLSDAMAAFLERHTDYYQWLDATLAGPSEAA